MTKQATNQRVWMKNIGIGIIGAGAVSDYHHVPAIELDSRATVVAVCDPNDSLRTEKAKKWNAAHAMADYREICSHPDVDAVIIATPNDTHKDIAIAAAQGGKHIMCEKPLGLSAGEVAEMVAAATENNVIHMTAFTYRFAPSMRYMKELVSTGALGEPRHFRSQRFLDLPETSWGWRQYKEKAGAGDLFDMTIHRIDFAMDLLGPLDSICGSVARFAPRTETKSGEKCEPSTVDDWSALIGHFKSGAVGVWEGTTLAKGYGLNGFGHEWAEINGSEGSAVYRMHRPNEIWLGKTGSDLAPQKVPDAFLKPADSPRSIIDGEPATLFRYDLAWEFVSAIVEGRPATPCFKDGLNAQLVADAVLKSQEQRTWIEMD